MQTVVDLGCGKNKLPGAIGVDAIAFPGVDVVWDLTSYPYPFADGSCGTVHLRHVLEHLERPDRLLEELYRIGAPGCCIEIQSPHFSSLNAYADFQHRHFLSIHAFDPYCGAASSYIETPARFTLLRREFLFWRLHDALPIEPYRLLGIRALANAFPTFYERFFAFIFPCREMRITLQKVSG